VEHTLLPHGLQDPSIKRMTEAISQDPTFMELAKDIQESMLSGGMSGMNLGGEGAEGAAREMPAMPNIDPSKYMEVCA
jgi:hypothetical protein